jgi:hypothetical protein
MTAPAFGITDLLQLGSDWEAQGVSGASAGTRAVATGDDGDQVASTVHNNIESGTMRYIYKGAQTDFPTAWAADSCDVGDIIAASTLLITALALDFSPCAEGKRPICTFTFRDGPTAAKAIFITDQSIPTYVSATPVVPSILAVTLGSAEVINCQWSLTAQFGEDLDKDGEFLAGNTYGGEESITLTFVGKPTSITSTGWDQTSGPGATVGNEKGNTAYDNYNYTFVRGRTRSP